MVYNRRHIIEQTKDQKMEEKLVFYILKLRSLMVSILLQYMWESFDSCLGLYNRTASSAMCSRMPQTSSRGLRELSPIANLSNDFGFFKKTGILITMRLSLADMARSSRFRVFTFVLSQWNFGYSNRYVVGITGKIM